MVFEDIPLPEVLLIVWAAWAVLVAFVSSFLRGMEVIDDEVKWIFLIGLAPISIPFLVWFYVGGFLVGLPAKFGKLVKRHLDNKRKERNDGL